MADWEEIKRLAADFQRAQLSSTVQKLSERNCIEIVQKLAAAKLVDVIYTTDGKEYLTPQELGKEIREELQVRGGRVNLVDLQQVINVDFSHIESKVNEIVKGDKSLTLVLGQIVDSHYLDSLAEEVNDKLQEQGQVTIAELTKTYDLPADFLSEAVLERLGAIIQGKVDDFDKDVIFTEAFVNRHRSKIRGAFSAVTKPVHIMNMMTQCKLQERLFYSVLEELVSSGRLAGSITGGRQDKALYVPDIYTKSQQEYVDNFLQQNGYLEYDSLTRLGISDPRGFIKKRYKGAQLVFLSTCCVGPAIQSRIEAEIDEALSTSTWVDVAPSMPSICTPSDVNQLVSQCVKSRQGALAQVFCDTIVTSDSFISSCTQSFNSILNSKAEQDVRNNPALLTAAKAATVDDGKSAKEDSKEKRRQKASAGSKGGGTQGRESKTKSTKKKYRTGKSNVDEDSDDETHDTRGSGKQSTDLEFMSVEEIEQQLEKCETLQECPDEFRTEIASTLYRPLKRKYQEIVKSVFLQTMGVNTGQARKKTHGELQEKINGLWVNSKLFERGIKYFSEEIQTQLVKHLLKTVCSDITNLVFTAVATEHMLSLTEEASVTPEIRLKLLSKLSDEKAKQILTKLHTSLSGKTLEDFHTQLEKMCGPDHLDMALKKPDKKKERQLLFSHRQTIAEQLRAETDGAMTLHLVAVLLFQVFTQCIVHAPGRCVPSVITYLKEHLSPEQHGLLTKCQELVVQQLKETADDGSEVQAEAGAELQGLLPGLKDLALTARRSKCAEPAQ